MNFGKITDNVLRRLTESQTTGAAVTWNRADVQATINVGYLDFCEQTGMVEREAELSCVAGLPYMDMRTAFAYPFLGLRRMYSRAVSQTMKPTSLKLLDDRDNRWEMGGASALRFFTRGLYVLGLYPVPATGQQFRASVTSLPDEMVLDTDEPEIPEDFHEALELYAVYDLKCLEVEPDIALEFYAKYQAEVRRAILYAKDQIKTSRSFTMGEPEPEFYVTVGT